MSSCRNAWAFAVSRATYYSGLGQTRPGRLLGALSFLRNRAGHQIAMVFAGTPAASATASYTVIGDDGVARDSKIVVSIAEPIDPFAHANQDGYRFAAINSLPSPDKSFAEAFARDTWYQELVAGQDVSTVLADMVGILLAAISIVREKGRIHADLHMILQRS